KNRCVRAAPCRASPIRVCRRRPRASPDIAPLSDGTSLGEHDLADALVQRVGDVETTLAVEGDTVGRAQAGLRRRLAVAGIADVGDVEAAVARIEGDLALWIRALSEVVREMSRGCRAAVAVVAAARAAAEARRARAATGDDLHEPVGRADAADHLVRLIGDEE